VILFRRNWGKGLHFLGQENGDTLGGSVVGNPDKHDVSAQSFDERGDLRFPALADNEVPFPESGNRAVLGLDRALTDVDHVRDLPPGHGGPGPVHPAGTALTQSELQLGAQLATRLQVQTLINRLVTHTHSVVVREVIAQPLADLFR